MSEAFIDSVKEWLTANSAREAIAGSPLSGVPVSAVTAAVVDLDGVHDSVSAILRLLSDALAGPFDDDKFETLLIDIDIEVEHLNAHWSPLRSYLHAD